MGIEHNKIVRSLKLFIALIVALVVFSSLGIAIPNPSDSDFDDNSTVLDEEDMEEIEDIIDRDALRDIIEDRKIGSILVKTELEKVVDDEKVVSRLEREDFSDIMSIRDMIDLIKDKKISAIVDEGRFDDFGELFEGEDFRRIGENIDLLQFTNKELGGFIKDDQVAKLLAHLRFRELDDIAGRKVIEDTEIISIIDDDRFAETVRRDDLSEIVEISRDEKLKDVIYEEEIGSISDIIDEGDLDRLLQNEDIAEALDDNDFGSELSDSELYNLLKNQKIGKLRPIMDKNDIIQFIDFRKVFNLAEGSSDFLNIAAIIDDEFIGDLVEITDQEDLGGIISDKDLGKILKKRGFSLGYQRDGRSSLEMRDLITDRGLSRLFEDKTIAEIEHLLQDEDADDLRRLIKSSEIEDLIDEEALLKFVSERDIFHVLEIIEDEDFDSILKDSVTDKRLAKIIRKEDLRRVVSDRDLGRLIKDESLGDFEDLLDDAALGRAIKDFGLARIIDDSELGSFLREKKIEDMINYVERDYDYRDSDRYDDRYDRDNYRDRYDRRRYREDRYRHDRYRDRYDDRGYRRDNYRYNRYIRCSEDFFTDRLPDSGRYYKGYQDRVYPKVDYRPPGGMGGHDRHLGRNRENDYGYSYGSYRYRDRGDRYSYMSGRYNCRLRDDITIREALGSDRRRFNDSRGETDSNITVSASNGVRITRLITQKIITPNNNFLISVEVSNRNDQNRNADLTVSLGDRAIGSRNIDLPSDGKKTLRFNTEYRGSSDEVKLKMEVESDINNDKFVTDLDVANINAFMQLTPDKIQSGENTLVKGGVEESIKTKGIETRANLYVDGIRRGSIFTDGNGRFDRHISVKMAGDHQIKIQNSDFSVSKTLTVEPVVDVKNLQLPEKIWTTKSFEICGTVVGKGVPRVQAALFIDSNMSENKTVETSGGETQVCFDKVFLEAGGKNIAIKAGLKRPEEGEDREIDVRHSLGISSGENVVERGNWSDLKVNISSNLSRERRVDVFLTDLEEGKAKELWKNITLANKSTKQVIFEIKTYKLGEYAVTVEASSEGYTRTKVIGIRSESSTSITGRTLKWAKKTTRSIRPSSDTVVDGVRGLWGHIYSIIRDNPSVFLVVLAIILLVALIKKARDVLVAPNTLEPYRY